jgi:hypothetical protein
MEKSSQIAWKLVPLRHFFPLKVVPLIEVLLYLFSAFKNGVERFSHAVGRSDIKGATPKEAEESKQMCQPLMQCSVMQDINKLIIEFF